MSERFVVNAPAVVGEIIDGEAVVMNLQTGQYFNSENSGAVIWSAIEGGASLEAIANLLCARYEIAPDAALISAATFVETLKTHDLIRAEAGADAGATAMPVLESRAPFAEPTLGVHTDLDDLLMLDPIHDVDEMGWPAPAKQA